MRLSKSTVIFLISIILVCVFFTNVANIPNTEYKHEQEEYLKNGKPNNVLKMTDTDNHLLWFVQISDIHISIFQDPSRITEFKEFCDYTINVIKPPVVIASGDLTDGKTSNHVVSKQIEKDWVHYHDILRDCNITKKTTWLDIRGNHDTFNVVSSHSKQNFFSNYSIQGEVHPRSYFYQMKKDSEIYSFIAIDATLETGPRYPFNFVGLLDPVEISTIENMVKQVEVNKSNYTIWFGHYPTSCILAQEDGGVRSLISKHNGFVYLSGHLHRIVPKMYTLHKAGFLELELSDWKDNRMYRLLAIDHGLLSFVDIKHRDWPLVLVTNPKDALFVIPYKEDLNIIKQSTHIRILAFSLADVKSVKVRINNQEWKICNNVKGPLYVTPWNPNLYSNGIHTIEVFVEDVQGREKYITQPFSLDGTQMSFRMLSRFILTIDITTFFKAVFGVFFVIAVFPLYLIRFLHKLVKDGRIRKPRLQRGGCCKLWKRKLWILSTVDRIFWPLALYPVYLTIGPWSIGYIIEDYLGAIFLWGICINGSCLPGTITYAFGFVQLLLFQIPLTLVLANGVDHRFQCQVVNPSRSKTILGQIGLHLPFVLILSIQLIMACFFGLAYGVLAFLLGPIITWSGIIASILWYLALTLPENCTRQASRIWSEKIEPEVYYDDENLNLNTDVTPTT